MQTLKAIIVCSPDALRQQLDQVSGKMTLLRRLAALRPGPLTSTLASAKASLRSIARRWLLLDAEIRAARRSSGNAWRRPPRPNCWRRTEWPRALRPRCCCLSATTLSASTRRQHSPSCTARLPDPGINRRQDHPAPPQPSRQPAGQRRPLSGSDHPYAGPPADTGLRPPTRRRGQAQIRDHTLPQTLRRSRDLWVSLPQTSPS